MKYLFILLIPILSHSQTHQSFGSIDSEHGVGGLLYVIGRSSYLREGNREGAVSVRIYSDLSKRNRLFSFSTEENADFSKLNPICLSEQIEKTAFENLDTEQLEYLYGTIGPKLKLFYKNKITEQELNFSFFHMLALRDKDHCRLPTSAQNQ